MKRSLLVSLALSAVIPFAYGQSGAMKGMDHKGMDMKDHGGMETKPAMTAEAKSHHAAGVVKSVDAGKGTVRLEHGPVASLSWPAMTMTFKAKDKKLLEQLSPGKKVEFDFVQQGKDYVITGLK